MMKTLSAVVFSGLIALIAPVSAHANVIYTFDPITVNPSDPSDSRPASAFSFTLELTNDAIRNRSFNLSNNGGAGPNPTYIGDVENFVNFNAGTIFTPNFARGFISISLSFSPQGNINNGRIEFLDEASFDYNIMNNFFSGLLLVDNLNDNCSITPGCFVSGKVVRTRGPSNIPEPGSLALLSMGALSIGVMVRRRLQQPYPHR